MTETSIENSRIDREMSNLETAIECLEWVATDFQLDSEHENYLGFINIDPSWFKNPKWVEFFSTLYITHRYFQVVFDHFGLELDSAIEDEIIISRNKHGN